MEIRQLKHFLAVAETRNFRRAAELVHLSQQAVSKSILQLERELAIQLFERGRQSVMLTEQGKLLLPYARDVLADVRRFDDAITNSMGRQFGQLRIGASPNLLDDVVPRTLKAFHARFPQSRLVVERGNFAVLRDMLLQGDLDLVLAPAPDSVPKHLVSARVMAQDRNVVVVRRDHPLAANVRVNDEDLTRYPLLAIHNYPRGDTFLDKVFAAGIPVPLPALKVGSTSFAASWVQQSDFWWAVPYRRVQRAIREGTMVALPLHCQDTSWNLIVATRRHARHTPLKRIHSAKTL